MHDTLWLGWRGHPWPIRGRWTDSDGTVDFGRGCGAVGPATQLPAGAAGRARHAPAARLPRARRRHPPAGARRTGPGGRQAARRAGTRPLPDRQPYDGRRRVRGAAQRGLPGVPARRGQLDRRTGREPAASARPGTAAARDARLDDRPGLCGAAGPRAVADPGRAGCPGGTAAVRAHTRRLSRRAAGAAGDDRRAVHGARDPDHARADHGDDRGDGRDRRDLPSVRRAG